MWDDLTSIFADVQFVCTRISNQIKTDVLLGTDQPRVLVGGKTNGDANAHDLDLYLSASMRRRGFAVDVILQHEPLSVAICV